MEVEVKSYEPVGGPDASFKRASARPLLPARLPVGVILEPVSFLSVSIVHIAPSGQGPNELRAVS